MPGKRDCTGQEETVPLVVTPEGNLNRRVREREPAAEGGKAKMVTATKVVAAASGSNKDGKPPAGSLAEELGGIPLELALSATSPLDLVTQPPRNEVVIDDLREILENKPISTDTGNIQPILDDASKIALLEGEAVDALAEYRTADGETRRTMVRLRPDIREVALDESGVDMALAIGVVVLTDVDQELTLHRTPHVDAALRAGSSVTVTAALDGGVLRPYRISAAPLRTSEPLAETFTIDDPSVFLRNPYLPAVDGAPLRVDLTSELVNRLRTDRAISFSLNGTEVKLQVEALAPPAATSATEPSTLVFTPDLRRGPTQRWVGNLVTPISELRPGGSLLPGGPGGGFSMPGGFPIPGSPGTSGLPGGSTGSVANPDPMTEGGINIVGLTPDPETGGTGPKIGWPGLERLRKVHLHDMYEYWAREANEFDHGTQSTPVPDESIPGPTKGLPVAIFLPWKQQWRFTGLSRGNLLSSIALAPLEERTIRMYSWERRSRALEQSTETETEMQQDYTSTTRDTEDVFREMTSNQKFNTQVGANLRRLTAPAWRRSRSVPSWTSPRSRVCSR